MVIRIHIYLPIEAEFQGVITLFNVVFGLFHNYIKEWSDENMYPTFHALSEISKTLYQEKLI